GVGMGGGVGGVGGHMGGEWARGEVCVGETPNRAARLQSVAAPNTTLIAASTLRLLGDVFVCERLEPFELKGFSEPVVAWRGLGERGAGRRFAALHSKKLTRVFGRPNEHHPLFGVWERGQGGQGPGRLVWGEAGIRKSRRNKALLDRIADDAHVTIRLQCSPFHTNRLFGRPRARPKKVGRIFGPRRGLRLPAWPQLGHNFANDLAVSMTSAIR